MYLHKTNRYSGVIDIKTILYLQYNSIPSLPLGIPNIWFIGTYTQTHPFLLFFECMFDITAYRIIECMFDYFRLSGNSRMYPSPARRTEPDTNTPFCLYLPLYSQIIPVDDKYSASKHKKAPFREIHAPIACP